MLWTIYLVILALCLGCQAAHGGVPREMKDFEDRLNFLDGIAFVNTNEIDPAPPVDGLVTPFKSTFNKDQRLFFDVGFVSSTTCEVDGDAGTCTSLLYCLAIGGSVRGFCSLGYGVCCYTEFTCGESSSRNLTYIVSPGYPDSYTDARTCKMSYTRSSDVCQLRLDFEEFTMVGPSNLGICTTDKLEVDGEDKFSYLCGQKPSSNWHFYLDVNGKANPTTFTFTTGATGPSRKFQIKVTQVKCSLAIPSGCGQYFMGSGVVQSFNYGYPYYLARMNYGICFRKEKNKCTATVTNNDSNGYVACPDIYRLSFFQNGAVPTIYFCQDPSNAFTPSGVTLPSNGPHVIWFYSNEDNVDNYLAGGSTTKAGFHQTVTLNDC